jgi:hypothetical protein
MIVSLNFFAFFFFLFSSTFSSFTLASTLSYGSVQVDQSGERLFFYQFFFVLGPKRKEKQLINY